MKVKNNQQAPDFTISDVNGEQITLSKFTGQKIHLVFYRFSGCMFCNLRFHQIQKMEEIYKQNNVKLISVYESSIENMRSHLGDERFYSLMIPDPDSSLYKLYELDRSRWGLIKYLVFKGGMANAMKGKKLFSKKVKHDGFVDRVGAEFLIDAQGKVINAYYGKNPGDFLPVELIKHFIMQ